MKKEANRSEIPAWAFILVGFIVASVSITMNIVNKNNSMILFIFVGVAMVGWGLAKIFIFGKKGKADFDVMKEEATEKKENAFSRKPSSQAHGKAAVKHCPKCGYALHKADNFCYNCGTDVRNL